MPSGAGEGGSPQIEAVFWDIGFSREAQRSGRRGSLASYPSTLSTSPTFSTSAEPMFDAATLANLARGEARPQALLGSCGWDRNGSARPPSRLRLLRCLRSLRPVSSCILSNPFSHAGLRIGGGARCVAASEHGYVLYVLYVLYVAARSRISAAEHPVRGTRRRHPSQPRGPLRKSRAWRLEMRRRFQLDSGRSARAAPRRGSPSASGRSAPAKRGRDAGPTPSQGMPATRRPVSLCTSTTYMPPCRAGAMPLAGYVSYVVYVSYV